MPRAEPRSVRRYSDEFKLTAVRLSQQAGIQVKIVAAALEIHPFMLSKWRKDARNGLLRGKALAAPPAAKQDRVLSEEINGSSTITASDKVVREYTTS